MTRIRESRTIAQLRRRAREVDDGSPLGNRLDAIARANGHGTWSSLVKAYSPLSGEKAPCHEPVPFPNLHYVSLDKGGVIGHLDDGTALRLHPGASASILLEDVDLSRRIAASAMLTDDATTFVVHGDGELMRRTSRHRSTVGAAMIVGDTGRHGCRIEPLTRPWMPDREAYVRAHVRDMLTCLSGEQGPDAEAHHQMLDCALSLVSQSGEVTIGAVMEESTRRHGITPWSKEDLAMAERGRILTPDDLVADRAATIYFRRTRDAWSRHDRLARTLQTGISNKRLGNLHDPIMRDMVVVYDGPATWIDQPTLLTTGDLGRSKRAGQILCGGSRTEFEKVNDPLSLVLYDAVTPVNVTADEGVLRIGIYRHDPVVVAAPGSER